MSTMKQKNINILKIHTRIIVIIFKSSDEHTPYSLLCPFHRCRYTIAIRSTDNGKPALFLEKNFTISVTDVNESPTAIRVSKLIHQWVTPLSASRSNRKSFGQYSSEVSVASTNWSLSQITS